MFFMRLFFVFRFWDTYVVFCAHFVESFILVSNFFSNKLNFIRIDFMLVNIFRLPHFKCMFMFISRRELRKISDDWFLFISNEVGSLDWKIDTTNFLKIIKITTEKIVLFGGVPRFFLWQVKLDNHQFNLNDF